MQRTVSIFGGGPSGYAIAADLESHGTLVLVYSHRRHLRHTEDLFKNGKIKVTGSIESFFTPRVTCNMREAISFSRTIVLAVPSTAQEAIWGAMKAFDLRQHTVVAVPGNLFSFVADAEDKVKDIFEANLSPYSCRVNDGNLVVSGKKRVCYIAGLQKNHGRHSIEDIQGVLLVELHWCSNIVEVCLSNINAVFHPLLVLMNLGRIEDTGGAFLFYHDGLTRSVANTMIAVDRVRLEIGQAFGFQLKSAIDVSNHCYGQNFSDLVNLARNSGPHKGLNAPTGLDSRNISEDVADLLVCWHGLAAKLGIDACPITAIIVLAGAAVGVDYLETGRNLSKLGLEDISRSELIRRFSAPSQQDSSSARAKQAT